MVDDVDDKYLSDFVEGSFHDLIYWMVAGILSRSDLLNQVMNTQGLVDIILEDFQSFMRNPAALLGYNPFLFKEYWGCLPRLPFISILCYCGLQRVL